MIDVHVKASLDSKDAVKGLVDVEKQTKKAANSISGLEAKAESLRDKLKGVSVGSEEFKKLQKELVKTDSALKNANKSIEGLDTEGKAGELGKIAGGLGAIGTAGALAFGDNEDAEAFFQTFAQGLAITQAAKGGIEAFTAVQKLVRVGYIQETAATIANTGAKIVNTTVTAAKNVASGASIALTTGVTAALGAQTVATGAASVATGVLGAAMAIALAPITLIIAAITAVVAAFAYFMSSSEDSTEASKKLSSSIKKQNKLRERQAELARKVGDQELELAKIQGKNADEILEIEKKNLKDQEDQRKKDIKSNQEDYDKLAKMRQKHYAEGDYERGNEVGNEMKALREKNEGLRALEGDYQRDLEVLDAQSNANKAQLADDLSDAELSELDKRLDDNEEYYDALLLKAGNNADLITQIEKQRTEKEAEIRAEDQKRRNKEYKQILRDREEAERDLRDAKIELIADDAERERAEFVASQEDRLAEIEKTYGKESELAQQFRDKQAADIKAYDDQVIADAEAKAKELEDKRKEQAKTEAQEAFNQQQRIDEAKLAAKEAGLEEGDVDGLLAINESRFQEEMETLRYQLEQGELTKAEFDALELQRTAEHEAKQTQIEEDAAKKREDIDRQANRKKAEMAAAAFDAIGSLVGAFNTNNEEDAKKQFKIQKAFNLASAITNTGLAVTAALTGGGNPLKLATGAQFAEAAIAASVGAANVIKIASTQFNGGGGSGPSGPSQPSAPTGPSIPFLGGGQNLTGGQGNQEAGTNQQAPTGVTKVIVLESEITTAQNNVASIEDAATFN